MQSKLGKLLQSLRKDEPLRDAAQRIGISHTYLSLLEKGQDPRTGKEIKPSAETLQKIAVAYNYKYEKLLDAAGYLEIKPDPDEPTPTEIEDIIRKADLQFDGAPLNEEDKEDIIGFVRLALKTMKKGKRGQQGSGQAPE